MLHALGVPTSSLPSPPTPLEADVPYSGLRKGGLLHRHPRQHATKIRCQGPVAGPPLPHSALSHIQHRHGTCPPSSPSQTQQRHSATQTQTESPLASLTLIPPFFSLTPSRNSEIKLRASSTHRRISLRSAGWPSRSLACSFVCRSALTTASSSPFCLVSLPPSKGTREPARRPSRPPTASQPSL